METAPCRLCKRVLSVDMFYSHVNMRSGRLTMCKTCAKDCQRARYGSTRSQMTVFDRFWSFVSFARGARGCWLWHGTVADGYGKFFFQGSQFRLAHRWVYEMYAGHIPVGMALDHLCRVRNCVRPDHLQPVTFEENTRRGQVGSNMRDKTNCPKGHPYSGDNLYVDKKTGRRSCTECKRLWAANDREAKRHANV